MLRKPVLWLGVLASAGALGLAVRGLNFGEVGDALREADAIWFVPALAALVIGFYLRALRWRVLFFPARGLALGNLFGAMNVGYMLNNLLPLRVGEVARAYVIGEVEPVSRVQALCTIVVERLLDVIVLLALLLVLLPFVDEPGWATGPALVLGGGALAISALLTAAGRARTLVRDIASAILNRAAPRAAERLLVWVDRALDAFASLSDPRVVLAAASWSVVCWGASSLYLYCMLRAFDLNPSYAMPLFVMVALNLGMVVPSSSGYLGVYHAIAIETLTSVFGVDRAQAAGFALASHAMFYVTPVALGMSYLWGRRSLWDRMLAGKWGGGWQATDDDPVHAAAPS